MRDSINFYGIGSSIYAYTDADARSEPFSNGSCFGRSTIVSRLSASLRALGGLWGLIVAEKPKCVKTVPLPLLCCQKSIARKSYWKPITRRFFLHFAGQFWRQR